jgi:hypothetical protein
VSFFFVLDPRVDGVKLVLRAPSVEGRIGEINAALRAGEWLLNLRYVFDFPFLF